MALEDRCWLSGGTTIQLDFAAGVNIAVTHLPAGANSFTGISTTASGGVAFQSPINASQVVYQSGGLLSTDTFAFSDNTAAGQTQSFGVTVQIPVLPPPPVVPPPPVLPPVLPPSFNPPPDAVNDTFGSMQGRMAFGSIAGNDIYIDIGPATFSIVNSVPNGTAAINPSSGYFTFTPSSDFAGSTAFTYKVTNQYGSDTATVTILFTNTNPTAGDDSFILYIPQSSTAMRLDVIPPNDFDPNGDELHIESVGASSMGATITIDVSRKFLWYKPPTSGSGLSLGGVIHLPVNIPEDGGGVEDTTDPGGWDLYYDQFQYVVADNLGATDGALVQVQAPGSPTWSQKLATDSDTAAEVRVDGTPGYNVNVEQILGANIPGLKAKAGTQIWQENTHGGIYMYFDAQGQLKRTSASNILADTNNITTGQPTPVTVTDTLGMDVGPGQTPLLILQSVEKHLGMNKTGKKLPVRAVQPWNPNPAQRQMLAQMADPKQTLFTPYIYVNITEIESRRQAGPLPDAEYANISELLSALGITYGDLSGSYEKLVIGSMGPFEYIPD